MRILKEVGLKCVNCANCVMQKFITVSGERLAVSVDGSSDDVRTFPRVLSRITSTKAVLNQYLTPLVKVRFATNPILSRLCVASLILMTLGVGQIWAREAVAYAWPNTSSTDKTKSLNAGTIPCGVAVSMGSSNPSDYYQYDQKSQSVGGTRYYYAKAGDGYYFIGWYTEGSYTNLASSNPSFSDGSGSGAHTRFAKFGPVTVTSVESNSAPTGNPLDIASVRPQTATVIFNVSHADATADFNYSVTGEGWEFDSWSFSDDDDQVTINVRYTATSSTTQGNHDGTVRITSKGSNDGTSNGTFSYQEATVRASVDLTPTLTYKNSACDVSVSDDDKVVINVDTLRTAYNGRDSQAGDGTITYALKTASDVASITSAGVFYAKATGTYTIVASASANSYYAKTAEFTITVNKRNVSSFVWQEFAHIYSGAALTDVAQAKYGEANATGLTYTYTSFNTDVIKVSGTTLNVQTDGFTEATDVKIKVVTAENDYYNAAKDSIEYYIEPKKTPVFTVNETIIPNEGNVTIDLLIGETANVAFTNIDNTESTFTKPSTGSYLTYTHNSTLHTGVITATAFGSRTLSFSQSGNDTIFAHSGSVTVNVKKHLVTLSTDLSATYNVEDSLDVADMYSIDPEAGGHEQSAVTIVSSNDSIIRYVDGKWRAKKAGTATLTFRMPSNDYWTGDTITHDITVSRKTPTFTWNVPNPCNWNRAFSNPVTSTNTDDTCTFSFVSSDPTVMRYEGGSLNTYTKDGKNIEITVTQKGNYEWNEHTETYTLDVEKLANHVALTVNSQSVYNAVYSDNEGDIYYDATSGIRLGGDTWNWDDKYVIIEFEGVPDSVSFSYRTNNKSASWADWYVQESADGTFDESKIWETTYSASGSYGSDTIELQPDTRYLKLCYSGNYAGYFKDVKITERKEIYAAKSADFGTRYIGSKPTVRTINVDWYNVRACTVTIDGTDADYFQLAEGCDTINSSLDYFDSKGIMVSYIHTAEGTHTATLHIESADGKSASVALSGTTQKAVQQIIWNDNVTPINIDVLLENAATATSGESVVLTAEDETVVSVTDGNSITGLKEGSTLLYAYQAGTDAKWAEAFDTIEVIVTSKTIQHIIWNDRLLNVKRESDKNKEVTLTAYSDADNTLPITYELDTEASKFASVTGNTLTVTGWGRGTITARQAGNETYVALTKEMDLISRNPNAGCNPLVLDTADQQTMHTIDKKSFDLNGEPRTIEFDASCDGSAINGMYVGEYYDRSWHEVKYIGRTGDNNITSSWAHFGPYNLQRGTTQVRLYTQFGATMRRYFKNLEVTLAKYLELDENDMDFSSIELGQVETQQFSVNYSNLTGTLDVELKHPSSQFTILNQTLGEECGETAQGVLITVRCTGRTAGTEKDTIVISNLDQRLEVPISATITKLTQTISWSAVSPVAVNTNDNVVLSATATSSLPVSFTSEDETIAETYQDAGVWKLRILKSGDVVIKAVQAGNDVYGEVEESRTYRISRVAPVITTWPTAANIAIPATLEDVELTGGEATVDGDFAWETPTTSIDRINDGYTVVFTPDNEDWYTTVTNVIPVTVLKNDQTITWEVDETTIQCDADITFDATASSNLAVTYTTSNSSIAYVDSYSKLHIVRGGEVTITAIQEGDETFAEASSIAITFTIYKITPEITAPTAAAIKIGKLLENATLSGGVARSSGNELEGIFRWKVGTKVMDVAGVHTDSVLFAPSNTNYYDTVYMEVDVTVEKFSPVITSTLVGSTINYGQKLGLSELSGTVTATDTIKVPNIGVAGTYGWADENAILDAGINRTATARFYPTDDARYNEVDFEVTLTINKITPNLEWSVAPESFSKKANVTFTAASNNSDGEITYEITDGDDYAEIDSETGELTITKDNGSITVKATIAASVNYTAYSITTDATITKTKTFTGNGSWGDDKWDVSPTSDDDVVINGNITISSEVEVFSLTIEKGATVQITPTGGLTVGEGGISGDLGTNLVLKASSEGETKGQTGYLRISPDYTGAMPQATVEMYSTAVHNKAAASGSKSRYQCVGVPISDEGVSASSVYPAGTWVYTWNESTETWSSCRASLKFKAFKGFETTQKLNASGKTYEYQGQIVSGHTLKTIDLDFTSKEKGYNLLANSFTAPIDITQFKDTDFVNVEQTIYILNAGTKNESLAPGEGNDAPGKWIGIPIKTAEELEEDGLPRMIPSMQGFWVRATDKNPQLKLDYSRLIWGVDYSDLKENKPLRAPKRGQKDEEEKAPITGKLKISIIGEEGYDFLYMLESERYDAMYENGYDAYKIESGDGIEIFTIEDEDQLCVDATNSIIGTQIGIRTGEESAYTLVFTRLQSEKNLALVDKETRQEIAIYEGTEYLFYAAPNETITDRFEIVERYAQNVTTGTDKTDTEVKAHKFVKDNSLYILRDGVLYDALGKRVR